MHIVGSGEDQSTTLENAIRSVYYRITESASLGFFWAEESCIQ